MCVRAPSTEGPTARLLPDIPEPPLPSLTSLMLTAVLYNQGVRSQEGWESSPNIPVSRLTMSCRQMTPGSLHYLPRNCTGPCHSDNIPGKTEAKRTETLPRVRCCHRLSTPFIWGGGLSNLKPSPLELQSLASFHPGELLTLGF